MRTLVAAGVLTALASTLAAQEARMSFEAASVKRNVAGAPGFGGPTTTSGARPTGFFAVNSTLLMLIRQAYGIEGVGFDDEYVTGGPGWIRSDRFDITATAGKEISRDQAMAMLRTLLEERFKLVVANEKRSR